MSLYIILGILLTAGIVFYMLSDFLDLLVYSRRRYEGIIDYSYEAEVLYNGLLYYDPQLFTLIYPNGGVIWINTSDNTAITDDNKKINPHEVVYNIKENKKIYNPSGHYIPKKFRKRLLSMCSVIFLEN